jgi:hypothetical protein
MRRTPGQDTSALAATVTATPATHRASAASQTDLRYSISVALVDVATDREVWILYSSFRRALGPGLIWAYGPQAQAIAVGTPGGGPD